MAKACPLGEEQRFMRMAMDEAGKAGDRGEVPAGAVLTDGAGNIIGRAGNSTIGLCDPTAHAEILALRQAAEKTGNYRLLGTTLYSTLEPCAMCLMAMIHARVDRLVFGAFEPKFGAAGSLLDLPGIQGLNHRIKVRPGILAEECGALLKDFFKTRRGTEVVVTGATRNRLVRC